MYKSTNRIQRKNRTPGYGGRSGRGGLDLCCQRPGGGPGPEGRHQEIKFFDLRLGIFQLDAIFNNQKTKDSYVMPFNRAVTLVLLFAGEQVGPERFV